MRKFDDATELTFLSKGVDKLAEDIEKLESNHLIMLNKQNEVFNLMYRFVNNKPSPHDESYKKAKGIYKSTSRKPSDHD